MKSLNEAHPAAVFVYYAVIISVLAVSMNIYYVGSALVGSLISFLFISKRQTIRSHLLTALLFLVMSVINPLVSHKGSSILLVINDSPVTLEAIIYGISASALAVAMLYYFRAMSAVLTGDKLMSVLSLLSPKAALIISMAIRYIPLFIKQSAKVEESQKALGLYKENSAIDRIRGRGRVFSVLVTWGLENGIITADSMSARGYGTGRRTRYRLYRIDPRDIIFLIYTAALGALSLIGVIKMDISYYPDFIPGELSALNILSVSAYFLLTLTPAILEIKERIKWKYLISKI